MTLLREPAEILTKCTPISYELCVCVRGLMGGPSSLEALKIPLGDEKVTTEQSDDNSVLSSVVLTNRVGGNNVVLDDKPEL